MKKIILVAAMLLAGLAASAQVHIGGGYTWQTLSDGSDLYWNQNGAYGGASFNIKINEYVGIAPGAYFIWATGPLRQKGEPTPDASFGLDMMELQIPLNVTFGVEMGNAGKLFIYGGPAFNLGLSCKMYGFDRKDFFKQRKDTLTENLYGDLGDDNDQINLKRYDAKVGVGFGYRIKFFELNAGYDFGLLNLSKNNGEKLHQNILHAGIAFCF